MWNDQCRNIFFCNTVLRISPVRVRLWAQPQHICPKMVKLWSSMDRQYPLHFYSSKSWRKLCNGANREKSRGENCDLNLDSIKSRKLLKREIKPWVTVLWNLTLGWYSIQIFKLSVSHWIPTLDFLEIESRPRIPEVESYPVRSLELQWEPPRPNSGDCGNDTHLALCATRPTDPCSPNEYGRLRGRGGARP